ncbi:MAG TPA: hypothetical protein VIM86_02675 [Thermodesulfobacteriota bacterium]
MRAIPSVLLRRSLILDAVVSGVTGLLLVAGATRLAGLLGLPEALLRWAGASLLPFAAFLACLGTRALTPRPAVRAVVAYNALWAIDSVLILALGWVTPTPLGIAVVAVQAAAVAALAGAQYVGMRGSPAKP